MSQEKNLLDKKENLYKNKKPCDEWQSDTNLDELVGRSHLLYQDR